MSRSSRFVAAGASALVVAGMIALAPRTAFSDDVRELRTLSLSERTSLPPATRVRFHGSATTLGALRDAHKRLMVSFSTAGARGRRVALAFKNPRSWKIIKSQNRNATPAPSAYYNVALASPTPLPLSVIGSLLQSMTAVVEPATKWSHAPIDEQQFCAAAAATACVYVPGTWPADHAWVTGSGIFFDDPVLDPATCASDNGQWIKPSVNDPELCQFRYFTTDTTTFPATAQYAFSYQDCDETYFGFHDDARRGAEQVFYDNPNPPQAWTLPNAQGVDCVVKVTTKPF